MWIIGTSAEAIGSTADAIIDDAKLSPSTSPQDPFSNFFVFPDQDSNGTPQDRAETATKHLSELNPDVIGSFTSVDSLETADYKSIFSSLAIF